MNEQEKKLLELMRSDPDFALQILEIVVEYEKKREADGSMERIEALRRVRDNPDADPAAVLRAVELLNQLLPKY